MFPLGDNLSSYRVNSVVYLQTFYKIIIMVDIKADTWTKSSFYYDEPSDICDRSFLISSVSREFPFQKTERRNWFEIKKSKSRDLHFQKSIQKKKKEKQNKKDS